MALLKPKIVFLLLVTAWCAMAVAHGGLPPIQLTLFTLLGLGLSAGGAHAVNMWYDRDIDRLMVRTQNRPVAAGRVPARRSLALGVGLEVASLALLILTVDKLAAALSLAGFLYYVFVYTMWLKRRSPLNIVIGGGAGSFPPLVGWAAVTGHVSLSAVLMCLVIFLWTPPHFWSLALYRQTDYRAAGIPMMPVARGERTTKWQSLGYALLLLLISIALFKQEREGPVYFVLAIALGVWFAVLVAFQLRERLPSVKWAKRTFRFSLLYLGLLFVAMVAGAHG